MGGLNFKLRHYPEPLWLLDRPQLCDNRLTVRQDELEGLVISALHSRLMDPALCASSAKSTPASSTLCAARRTRQLASAKTEIAKLAKDRDRLIEAIKAGVPAIELKDDLARIAARRKELEALLATSKDEPVTLHPGMAEHHRKQVATLADAPNAEANRAEAAGLLRGLIDLYGDLAGILALPQTETGRSMRKSR